MGRITTADQRTAAKQRLDVSRLHTQNPTRLRRRKDASEGGSGSTLMAAKNCERQFIGIELDPRHRQTARLRLEKAV